MRKALQVQAVQVPACRSWSEGAEHEVAGEEVLELALEAEEVERV